MLTVYCRSGDCLAPTAGFADATLPDGALWIDMEHPTRDEDKLVEGWLGIAVPTREDMREIEESSRFYTENGAQYFTVPILHGTHDGLPGIAAITFILSGRVLVTVRYTQPKSFALYLNRATKPARTTSATIPMVLPS